MVRQTDRQTDRQTGRQADRQTECSTPVTIPISTSGTSILGVPIGDPENISSFCLEFAKCLCDQLLNLDDPQAGMLL